MIVTRGIVDLRQVAHDLSSIISSQNFTAKLLERSGLNKDDHALIFVRATELRMRTLKSQILDQIATVEKNKNLDSVSTGNLGDRQMDFAFFDVPYNVSKNR